MRTALALSLLLVLTVLLSGCTGGPAGDGGDGDDGTDGEDGTSPTPTSPTGRENNVVPPKEQRVDDPDDVDRPGEYALLEPAEKKSDATWKVPTWKTGDTWRYRHHIAAGTTCDPETEDEVTGTGTSWEVDVYHVERTEIDCKDGSTVGTKELEFTKSDLLEIAHNGYIEHVLLFPFEDGQRWVFARDDGRGGASKATAIARYEANYQWPGTTELVKAWRVIVEYEGEGEVEVKYWVGVDQKNVLRREIWAEENGVATLWFSTTLESYTPG